MNSPDQQLAIAAARALELGNLEQAEAVCEQMLSRSKKNPAALYLMGCTLYAQHRRDEAVAYLERCVRLDPKNPIAHFRLGEVHTANGNYTAALSRFDKAQKLEPQSTNPVCGKAEVFDRRREHKRVQALLEPYVASGREDATMARLYARALQQAGRTEEAISLLRRHIENPSDPPRRRRELAFLLGKMHEGRGEYDLAFAAYQSAHAAFGDPYDPEAYRRRIDELIEVFSGENLAQFAQATVELDLPVFIVGMPRCGSTLVERIIDAHPLAYGAGEIPEMSRLVRSLSLMIGSTLPYPQCVRDMKPPDADRAASSYVDRVKRIGGEAERVADKFLSSFEHLGLISLILPRARVIHCRRNPLDTCLSCFGEALHPSGHRFTSNLEHLGLHFRQYERLMNHWKNVLNISMLEVRYEDLIADQEGVSRKMIAFVDLPWDERCLRYYESKREVMTLSREQVNKPIYKSSVNRAERFGHHLEPLKRALAGE